MPWRHVYTNGPGGEPLGGPGDKTEMILAAQRGEIIRFGLIMEGGVLIQNADTVWVTNSHLWAQSSRLAAATQGDHVWAHMNPPLVISTIVATTGAVNQYLSSVDPEAEPLKGAQKWGEITEGRIEWFLQAE